MLQIIIAFIFLIYTISIPVGNGELLEVKELEIIVEVVVIIVDTNIKHIYCIVHLYTVAKQH